MNEKLVSVKEGVEGFVLWQVGEDSGRRGHSGAVLAPGAGVRVATLRVLAVSQAV